MDFAAVAVLAVPFGVYFGSRIPTCVKDVCVSGSSWHSVVERSRNPASHVLPMQASSIRVSERFVNPKKRVPQSSREWFVGEVKKS